MTDIGFVQFSLTQWVSFVLREKNPISAKYINEMFPLYEKGHIPSSIKQLMSNLQIMGPIDLEVITDSVTKVNKEIFHNELSEGGMTYLTHIILNALANANANGKPVNHTVH